MGGRVPIILTHFTAIQSAHVVHPHLHKGMHGTSPSPCPIPYPCL